MKHATHHPALVTSSKLAGKSAKTEEPNFSLLHSNILYLLFFVGSLTCLGADMALQRVKNKFIKNNTKLFVSFFAANVFLWIDFNFNKVFRKPNPARSVYVPCEELFQYSTNILLCIIIAPFILLTKGMR